MKTKLIIFATLLASSAAFGQLNFSTFCSLSTTENKGPGLKQIGTGADFSYAFTDNLEGSLLWRNKEWWSLNGEVNRIVPLETFSLRFCVHQSPVKESKWSFLPKAGILVGMGTPIKDKGQSQSLAGRNKDFQMLKHPYFFGIVLEVGAGLRLSEKFVLSVYLRDDAMIGMMTNRAMINENVSTNSIVSLGFNLGLDIR